MHPALAVPGLPRQYLAPAAQPNPIGRRSGKRMNRATARSQRQERGTPRPTCSQPRGTMPRFKTGSLHGCLPHRNSPGPSPWEPDGATETTRSPVSGSVSMRNSPLRGIVPASGGLTRGHGTRWGRVRESIPAPVVRHRRPETDRQGIPSRPVQRQPGPNCWQGTRGCTVTNPARAVDADVKAVCNGTPTPSQGRPTIKSGTDVERAKTCTPRRCEPIGGQIHESGCRRDAAWTDPLWR